MCSSDLTAETGLDAFTGRQEIESVGGFEQPKFDSPQMQLLEQWLLRKQALAPDALTDSLFAQVLSSARNGNTSTAQAMRDLLNSTDPAALEAKLKPGTDKVLAHDLAAVAIGMDNPVHTTTGWAIEGGQPSQHMGERMADRPAADRRQQRIQDFEGRRARQGETGDDIKTVRPGERMPEEPQPKPEGEPRNVLPEAVRQERRAAEREGDQPEFEPMPRKTISEVRASRYPGSEALALMAMDPTGSGIGTMSAVGIAAAYGAYKLARRWYQKPGNAAKVKGWLRHVRTEQPRFFEKLSKAGKDVFSTAVKRQVQRRAEIEEIGRAHV